MEEDTEDCPAKQGTVNATTRNHQPYGKAPNVVTQLTATDFMSWDTFGKTKE